ncbi:MAG: TonB-dependent receptor [Bacteroidales bacterium]|nr:TonB-dependent receptor [Bacteroidales bacterium]MDY4520426.1 TonB-dependent receptor [Bacteroidales bacterium]
MNSKSNRLQKFWLLIACAMVSLTSWAQSFESTGTVVDAADKSPIPGVAVMVKGTTVGTVTDFDGKFSIKANQGDILILSFVGYKTVEVAAAPNMNLTLETDALDLEDVVVIGYGVARKTDLTGSVTAIKPDEKNKGLVTNPQDMIQGKIAGVNVTTNSGTPGAGASIRIRGGSSLNASNSPLIVIDGLAMDNNGVKGLSNPLSMVNPADIETFTVLKDASATAIYGSRGSNGVIIITTKKGLKGKRPQITYNGNISVACKKNLLEVLDGDEYREFVTNTFSGGSVTDETRDKVLNALGTENTDWQDEIYQVALGTDHNVTVNGGNDRLTYRASVGYTGQEGILKTSDFKRLTVSANLSPNFLDKHLNFNLSLKGMYAKTVYANTDAVGAALSMDPTQPVRSDEDKFSNWGGYWQWLQAGSYNDSQWPWIYNSNATGNPVALLETKDDQAKSYSFVGNLEGTYKIHGLEDLSLHGNFGWDASKGKQETTIEPGSTTNPYYGWDGWDEIKKYNININAYIQYMKDFNDANHFDIMAGYEYQKSHSEQEYDGSGFYQKTNNDPDKAGQPYQRNAKLSKWENFLVSFFGRLNYSFKDRYALTATLRYDGSSRFDDHWGLFPSAAFAWNAKQENFLYDVDAITNAKLRLSYGKTGQQEGIGNYGYLPTYTNNTTETNYYPIIGDGNMSRPDAYNTDLSWETTETYNVGIDLGFIHDRISFSADVYYRETTDLLNQVYVAAGSNFRNQVMGNVGKLENTGVELQLTVRPIQTEDWHWELTANAAYNKNEITELIGEDDYKVTLGGVSSGTGSTCQAHTVGESASSFYVYQQVYGQDGKPIEGMVVDRNGDGQLTEADKYFYKNPTAPWTMGLSSRLQWKNVDFGFSLRASIGNYVYNDVQAGKAGCGPSALFMNEYLQNRTAESIASGFVSSNEFVFLSDYYVQNASFLKCDNITLGYSFNNLFGSKLNGRVYGTVSNVFTVTDYEGVDPEVDGGIDNNMYPRPISALVGLTLNF